MRAFLVERRRAVLDFSVFDGDPDIDSLREEEFVRLRFTGWFGIAYAESLVNAVADLGLAQSLSHPHLPCYYTSDIQEIRQRFRDDDPGLPVFGYLLSPISEGELAAFDIPVIGSVHLH